MKRVISIALCFLMVFALMPVRNVSRASTSGPERSCGDGLGILPATGIWDKYRRTVTM